MDFFNPDPFKREGSRVCRARKHSPHGTLVGAILPISAQHTFVVAGEDGGQRGIRMSLLPRCWLDPADDFPSPPSNIGQGLSIPENFVSGIGGALLHRQAS